jgi:multiple sugar transport system permease protein
MRKSQRNLAARRTIVMIVTALLVLAPIFWFVVVSFTNYEAVLRGQIGLNDLTLRHYQSLSERMPLRSILMDTVALAAFAGLLAVMLGVPTAYAISRQRGKLSTYLYTTSLTLWLVPPVAFSLQLFFWFLKLGLYDQIQGLLILHTIINATLVILLWTPFMDGIPKRLDEIAWIDGYRGFAVLWRVHLPAFRQLLMAILMLCFVRSWNELIFASILTDSNVRTISVSIQSMLTGSHIDWGQIAALGTLALLPAPIIILVLGSVGVIRRWQRTPGEPREI